MADQEFLASFAVDIDKTRATRLQVVLKENRTVSVPVSIKVYASGAKAEQIGQSVYDTAERGFLRTLKSVTA